MNHLLDGFDDDERAVLAGMLRGRLRGRKVGEALVVLHEANVRSFEDGYEAFLATTSSGRLRGLVDEVE